jgi:hypothetical protein
MPHHGNIEAVNLHRGRTYRKSDRIATMTRKPRGDDRDSARSTQKKGNRQKARCRKLHEASALHCGERGIDGAAEIASRRHKEMRQG